MASLNAAIEYQDSLLRGVYDAAIQRYTEALLAGVDDRKAQHDLDAACEIGDNHYTEALNNLTEEVSATHFNATLANDIVTVATPANPAVADARLANDDEQYNCNFVVVAQAVE